MDFLATDGARVFAVVVLSGLLIIDAVWEWFRRS